MYLRFRLGAVVVAVLALLGTAAHPAWAHEVVEATSPVAGARLETVPAAVSVSFSGQVDGSVVMAVIDEQGRHVENGPATRSPDGRTITVTLTPGIGVGGYVVEFATTSEDGHPVGGTFGFMVGDEALPTVSGASSAAADAGPLVNVGLPVLRWLAYLGLMAAGGLVFVRVAWQGRGVDPRIRQVVRAGCLLSAAAAAGELTLHAAYLQGSGWVGALRTDALAAALGMPYGRLLVLRLVAALVLTVLVGALVPRSPDVPLRSAAALENLALCAGLALLLGFAASGHPAADELPLVTLLADLVHLAALATWLGGLAVVAAVRGVLDDDPGEARRRFTVLSAMSAGAVAVAVASGCFLALRLVGSPVSLVTTDYGRFLAAKLVGVAALLAAAGLARRTLHRRVPTEPQASTVTALRALRATALIEVAVGTGVLLVAARLVSTAPP